MRTAVNDTNIWKKILCVIMVVNFVMVIYIMFPKPPSSGATATDQAQSTHTQSGDRTHSAPSAISAPSPPATSATSAPSAISASSPPANLTHRLPTLILYVYAESGTLKTANLQFFLKYGLCENCPNVDYVIVVNGASTLKFPTLKNLRVLYRDNVCGDFGAWDHALSQTDYAKYKRIMFLNDTVKGPFIDPHYRQMLGKDFHFTDIFAFHINERTKMVGSYINCEISAHVQSMSWMTDDVGIKILRPRIRCYGSKYETVLNGEIGMSTEILTQGYTIKSLLYAYTDIEIDLLASKTIACNGGLNPTIPNQYFSIDANPVEVVFFKNTHGALPVLSDRYSEWLGRPSTQER